MKRIIFILIVIFVLASCGGSESQPTRRPVASPTAWYDGGTLHGATVEEWNSADNANRLATAGDWVTTLTGWETLEEAREKAEDLRTCVNESAAESPPELKVAELAVACKILMGWPSKE